jgi:adenylate cyclase
MRRWQRGLIVGACIGLGGVLLALTPYYLSFETRVGLYTLFHLRGARPPPTEVTVVAIDGRTGSKLGLPDLPREWPRSIHARLVDELVRSGAAVIVFDMDFRRPKEPEPDRALAEAIARADRVVLFEHLNGRRQPIEDQDGRHRGAVWVEELESPMPILAQAAKARAPFPLPKLDAAVDQFWTFKASARDVPTMPVAALQVYALGAYAEWLGLLASAGAGNLESLPRRVADIGDAEGMTTLMLNLRRVFEQAPGLAEAALSSAPASGRLLTALRGLYAGPNERYLNYYGPPGTISTLPYHAVLAGGDPNLPAEALNLRGKAVFVGYSDLYDPGQPDRFYTVFTRDDGVDLSGVEIAATAFANLLRDESLQPPGAGATLGALLVFGVLMGALIYLAPASIGVPAGIGLAALYALGAQWAFNQGGHWWPLATPLLIQFPLALVVGLFGQYRLEHRRAKHISQAIRYYVPEDVSRRLTASELDSTSVNQVTYSTCLATDMAGFSTIAEKMKAGDLAAFLNEYFETLAEALKRHGVVVTEFRADAIMCAWTGPANDPRVRRQPILAALEATAAIGLFNVRRNLPGSLRVGLADGEVYVGHAGGGGHFVFSIVGDSANTASRIEGLNKHLSTQILATGTVVAGFDDLLLRPLGSYRFVGKSVALPIAEIMAIQAQATAGQRELCQRFAAPLAAFEAGDWERAAAGFEDVLLAYPHDGPSRFLLARCRTALDGGAGDDEPGVINMTAK